VKTPSETGSALRALPVMPIVSVRRASPPIRPKGIMFTYIASTNKKIHGNELQENSGPIAAHDVALHKYLR
jgi:hypothetical protein